jgi:hypothetical protein
VRTEKLILDLRPVTRGAHPPELQEDRTKKSGRTQVYSDQQDLFLVANILNRRNRCYGSQLKFGQAESRHALAPSQTLPTHSRASSDSIKEVRDCQTGFLALRHSNNA